jgi:hypothetical protein
MHTCLLNFGTLLSIYQKNVFSASLQAMFLILFLKQNPSALQLNLRLLSNVRLQTECIERRHKAQMVERNRRKDEKLTELEEEEMLKSEMLLQKALEQRQEDEDEIKKLNEVEA